MAGDFDFGSLSPAQLDALSSVAFGGHGDGCNPRTLAALESKGLIEPYEETVGSDVLGPIVVKRWDMMLSTHIAFCAYCEVADAPARRPRRAA